MTDKDLMIDDSYDNFRPLADRKVTLGGLKQMFCDPRLTLFGKMVIRSAITFIEEGIDHD